MNKQIKVFLILIPMLLFLAGCAAESENGTSPGGKVTEAVERAKTRESAEESDRAGTESEVDITSPNPDDETIGDVGLSENKMESENDPANKESGTVDITSEKEEPSMAKTTLYYQGHASVRITTAEGKTIYVDPFMGDGYDVLADLILITHGHYDHTQTDLIKTKGPDCRTITYKEALSGGTHQTFDLGYVKVEAVEAGYNKNHNVKECVGYILTFSDGVTLYLSGDTSKTKDMETFGARNLDYAFFCCDGVYNMDMKEAMECARLVNAKHSIPYHMVPANKNGFDASVAASFDVPGRIILKPGEELVLE